MSRMRRAQSSSPPGWGVDKLSSSRFASTLLMATCLGLAGCPGPEEEAPPAADESVYFRDVAAAAGLNFVHVNGASPRKYLPEIMGSGGAVLDFDGDGWMDLYLVQSGQLPGSEAQVAAGGNRLFRNRGDGTFEDVTAREGVGDKGYGMGAVSADYDNDGDPDLFVVNFGHDVLYRNNGDGTFSDVTSASGIDGSSWGSSAAFFDADADGSLDLYVVNYLDFAVSSHVDCGTPSKGIYSYCHPDVYEMEADIFYRGDGRGGFTDATVESGLQDTSGHGKGLGVVAADLDDDGDTDIYVANDSTPNFLFRNLGGGRFEEVGLFSGTSHNGDGMTEAGMGTDAGDVNGDGRLDIIVTNLSQETNALYLGGDAFFDYGTRRAGLYGGSLMQVGFGVDLLDVDNDADLDILVTNGHVDDTIELKDDAQTFRQPSQLFLNDGTGRFALASAATSGDIAKPGVGRGTLTFDYDNDGRLDVVVTRNNEAVALYRNTWQTPGRFIGFLLQAAPGNRDAIGSRVTVEFDGRRTVEERKAGSSYQTSGDPRLHFGLGGAQRVSQVTVRWPDGQKQSFEDLAAGRYYRLVQGVRDSEPLPAP